MTFGMIFLARAPAVAALPAAVSRFARSKGMVPPVVAQLATGSALGLLRLGRMAREFDHLFANPAALSSLSGIRSVAVLVSA